MSASRASEAWCSTPCSAAAAAADISRASPSCCSKGADDTSDATSRSSVDTGEHERGAERPSATASPPVSSWSGSDASGSAPKSSLTLAAHSSRCEKPGCLATAEGESGGCVASGVVSVSGAPSLPPSKCRTVPSEQARRRSAPLLASRVSFVAHGSDGERVASSLRPTVPGTHSVSAAHSGRVEGESAPHRSIAAPIAAKSSLATGGASHNS